MLTISKSFLITLLVVVVSQPGQSQRATPNAAASKHSVPQYQIFFDRLDPVRGLNFLPVFALPFECTSDGTVYVEMFHTGVLIDPSNLGSRVLVAVTPSGEMRSYSLAGTPDLHNMTELSHFAWDSGVAFLVRARDSSDNKNAALHDYIIIFDLDGRFRNTIQIADAFHAAQFGVFPSSGYLLIYGYEPATNATRLALFNNDGTLLKNFHLNNETLRKSAALTGSELKEQHLEKVLPKKSEAAKDSAETPQIIAPVQFVPYRDSIIMVQSGAAFPLIKIRESGSVTVIALNLPKGAQIHSLIPSDGNLFARGNNGHRSSIYEIDPETNRVIREFQPDDDEGGHNIACVHENAFLSFEHDWEHQQALIPLLGRAEPIVNKAVGAQ